eukprot:jgi/Undpi1/4564/HiC_scaffold_18.g07918.m1
MFGSNDDWTQIVTCGVEYTLTTSDLAKRTVAAVKIALSADSGTSKLQLLMDGEVVVSEWEGTPGSTKLQEVPGVEGVEGSVLVIQGIMEPGDYLAISEVEIYLTVDDVEAVGVSAATRSVITATAAADASSAMKTLDGNAADSSSWTCPSGSACEITYDLQAVESLEQLRVAFSTGAGAGGQLKIMAAGESGEFFSVRDGITADGRPAGSDGLQTFGGVRALARFVKIVAVPANGGNLGINEASLRRGVLPSRGSRLFAEMVEFRVGEVAPARPVDEKAWLKPTGMLPLGADTMTSGYPNYDLRSASDGGCDPVTHFEGCHIYYIKDGDMDSRWACGPLSTGRAGASLEPCDVQFSLNYYRYVRQIQLAFHVGEEEHHEFSIEARTVRGWTTVVSSAIASGTTAGYQTFDVRVHANEIKLVPKFKQYGQHISISEMVILEQRKNDFVAGTVPVFTSRESFAMDDDGLLSPFEDQPDFDTPTRFAFDIPKVDDQITFDLPDSTVTALRLKFPANRTFEFNVEYGSGTGLDYEINTEAFVSAGGKKAWETFTFSSPALVEQSVSLVAVSGPAFASVPDYPTLRALDLQFVGELIDDGPGDFSMVTTTMTGWNILPDIIGDGVSDQKDIMTAICETKGATYDGVDCVGELNDASVHIGLQRGDYFLDGPVFVKSGVTLDGGKSDDAPTSTFFNVYEGDGSRNKAAEDAVIVISGATDAAVEFIDFRRKSDPTGDIVPGTVGNLCLDVRNSQDLRFDGLEFTTAREGAARFTDSKNISARFFWGGEYETGNYMELTRVDDFYVKGFPHMQGLLMDTCNNVVWEGYEEFETPSPGLSPPVGGGQAANVVITGDSSGIVFQNVDIISGAEPRILMESTEPLTLDNVVEYEGAVSGDCIVEVPAGTSNDLIVQVNSEQTLSKSGKCWVLD